MNTKSLAFLRNKRLFFLAIIILICGLNTKAYCQTDGVALLLQQTPADGGTVTPDVGVHNYELNTPITLTAVPRPGYQFVYWVGDVSDPTANTTLALLDTPKIIIAVFERSEYEFEPFRIRPQSMPVGGLSGSAGGYGGGGGGGRRGGRGGRGGRPQSPQLPTISEEPPEELPEDFPVPPEGNDTFPVPESIPEPATFILLSLGSLGLLRNHSLCGRKRNCY